MNAQSCFSLITLSLINTKLNITCYIQDKPVNVKLDNFLRIDIVLINFASNKCECRCLFIYKDRDKDNDNIKEKDKDKDRQKPKPKHKHKHKQKHKN